MNINYGRNYKEKFWNQCDNYLIENYIERISYRDREAFGKLYELTKSAVYGFALSIIKNVDDAEDVLHEVYIKIYDNACKYQYCGKPMAWILTITKNVAYNKLKMRKHTENIDEMLEILASNENITVENKIILEIAFKNITDEERNILVLHIVAGLKYREIAKFMNIPLSTVLSKYHRTIKKLKLMFSQEDVFYER